MIKSKLKIQQEKGTEFKKQAHSATSQAAWLWLDVQILVIPAWISMFFQICYITDLSHITLSLLQISS